MSTTLTKKSNSALIEEFVSDLKKKNPGETEFHQAVQEVAESVLPFVEENPKYKIAKIFERMTVPDRIVIFRVDV